MDIMWPKFEQEKSKKNALLLSKVHFLAHLIVFQ